MSNKRKLPAQKPKTSNGKVLLVYLTRGTVHDGFMKSVIGALYHDIGHDHRLIDGGGVANWVAGANLSDPRNKVVKQFRALNGPDWLLFVDDDMTFQPDAIDRLVESADAVERPIVGGLCFGLSPESPTGMLPTLYTIGKDAKGEPAVARYFQIPDGGLIQVAGTGTGFLLIHRSVFEKFDAHDGGKGFSKVFPYFQESLYGDQPIGEDLTFCFRAGLLGIPVYVNTDVRIGHMKERQLDYQSYMDAFSRSSYAAELEAKDEAG